MRVTKNPLSLMRLYARGQAAARYATTRGAPGLEFNRFGNRLGYRLLQKGALRAGIQYLLNPVSIVRYFEFPFALSCLPARHGSFLDVGSPRLFGLYVAEKYRQSSVTMINPDPQDASETAKTISKLRIANVGVKCCGVDLLAAQEQTYDCIWAISVVEHIYGKYDDSAAIRLMYRSLNKDGRLILTFPVDRNFWVEYRERDYYGTQPSQIEGRRFFQRIYDKASIEERLLAPIEREPSIVQWFGETTLGRYKEYEELWMSEGLNCTVEDPREIADHYREFSSWEEMPGLGVCGLMIEKS